jgi:hypothetical protein
MAASALRHYSLALSATGITTVCTVPSARALVVGKILVAATGASTISLYVNGNLICANLPLSNGQIYTETNLVALAGETIQANASIAGLLSVHVFGEEVDN